MDRPLLLIDVDGVLNPFGARTAPPGFTTYRLSPVTDPRAYRVHLSPRHGELLTGLADRFELVWATTWEHEANRLIAPLVGLSSDLPVITFDSNSRAMTSKLPAVIAYVGERPCAWIDDDLARDSRAWADERTAAGIPTLLVCTDPAVGLVRRHIDALARFAASLARRS